MTYERYETLNKIVTIPLELIDPNPMQPRKFFSEETTRELAYSIKENGLLQPILLRTSEKTEGRYELICGERRLRAFKMLGEQNIPAIITAAPDAQSAMFSLVENMSRQELGYFEEAEAISALIGEYGYTQEEIGQKLCRAQSTVANKLRLLKLPEEVRKKLLLHGLSERHARAILPITDKQKLLQAVELIKRYDWTVTATEEYVKRQTSEKMEKLNRPIIIKDLRIFSNTIKRAVDTMKEAGIPAVSQVEENENEICYTIKIPKEMAYKKKSTA